MIEIDGNSTHDDGNCPFSLLGMIRVFLGLVRILTAHSRKHSQPCVLLEAGHTAGTDLVRLQDGEYTNGFIVNDHRICSKEQEQKTNKRYPRVRGMQDVSYNL